MEMTKQLQNKLNDLLEKANDENIIKGLGEINILVENLDKEYDDLNAKHIELIKDYTKMSAFIGTKDSPTDGKEETPLTLEEIIKQVTK